MAMERGWLPAANAAPIEVSRPDLTD